MKIIRYFFGMIITVLVVFIALTSAVDIVAFKDKNFYYNQYEVNNVYDTVGISKDDLARVTDSLIDYMCDAKENLNLRVKINGESVEFFNQREIDHMVDVKNLIVTGLKLRAMAFIAVLVCVAMLVISKADVGRVLSRSFTFGIPVFAVFSAIVGYIISLDFETAFIRFHEILFTNDLWVLDYTTDRLINIVPEPFFIAMAAKIGIVFIIIILVIFFASLFTVVKNRKRKVYQG